MEIAPAVHRIGNEIVAAYLVVDTSGVLVVDAGLPGHWRDLTRELRTMGRGIGDIRGVVLTHGDSDHLGFAERLRRDHGVPVHVHAADAGRARGKSKPASSFGPAKAGAVIRFAVYSLVKGGWRTHHLAEVIEVEDGDVLDLPGAPVVIGLPGHSPGSIAVHVPSVDAVFVGDALTTRHVLTGARGPRPAPFTDDPALALESLERLESVGATWVLPGHGTPWSGGVTGALREVRAAARA